LTEQAISFILERIDPYSNYEAIIKKTVEIEVSIQNQKIDNYSIQKTHKCKIAVLP